MSTPGPSDGFSEFMAARWSTLYRFAYLLTGDPHQAEDLAQGALARTCVRWSSIRDKGAAEGYVKRAMTNEMARQWPRRRREVPVEEVPETADVGGLDLSADHLVLWEQIRMLPPRMRATLVLRYFEDLSEADTADALGCSRGAVKSATHHALRRLRVALPDLRLDDNQLETT